MLKINGKIAERPQHMYMRVAVGIHGEDIDAAIEVIQIYIFIHAQLPTCIEINKLYAFGTFSDCRKCVNFMLNSCFVFVFYNFV